VEAYLGLFAVAFLAATVLPAYSEVLFAGLMAAGHPPLALWAWATAGNTLGAALNWVLGRFLLRFQDRRWFPFRADTMGRSQRWFQRWGKWSLLMAWLPVGGDALTFIAGVMRVRFVEFLALTAAGKGARYAILLGFLGLAGQTLGLERAEVAEEARAVVPPAQGCLFSALSSPWICLPGFSGP
jgi:membrane protein YqaA with SNARE-associated domain